MLHGELAIGSEASPHTRKATITFTDNVPNEDVMAGMGDRGIMISGGTLNLHGDRTHTWTKLANTAECRQHFDRSAERRRLARRRRDRSRVDGLRSAAGRAAHDLRDQRQHDHARPEARLHALRQDHVRRGRARRSRLADAQHQDPGVGRCGAVVLRRSHHGDAVEQDVCRGRRAQSHGPASDQGSVSDPLASGRRRARASTSRTPRSTTPSTAA